MNDSYKVFWILLLLIFFGCDTDVISDIDENDDDPTVEIYFPPTDSDTWETSEPDSLGWDSDQLESLKAYLDQKGTKGFIILKDGKIVVEEYFNGHTANANWEWYSAAKSFTSTMVGVGVHEGLIDIENKTSDYLGENWSIAPQEKQDLIKVRHHLSMSTGLKNKIGDIIAWTCTNPICLQYDVDAGTKWGYHQGAFTLTQEIITQSTGMDFKQYAKQKIQDKIGMNGSWSEILDLRIFSSSTRSMARFGLLALNEGTWNEQVIYPSDYHKEMIASSQDLNESYGYLWWLNGKESFLGTADQTLYSGKLIPNAPDDMYAALGAQDQKVYVVPSQNLVVVRCGEPAGNVEFASSSFDNELWGILRSILL